MTDQRKVSQSEINKRIKQVTMEADFRFKCLKLAQDKSKDLDSLLENATKIYNYAFHINEEEAEDGQE